MASLGRILRLLLNYRRHVFEVPDIFQYKILGLSKMLFFSQVWRSRRLVIGITCATRKSEFAGTMRLHGFWQSMGLSVTNPAKLSKDSVETTTAILTARNNRFTLNKIYSSIHPFVHPSIRPFIHSFIHSFMHFNQKRYWQLDAARDFECFCCYSFDK